MSSDLSMWVFSDRVKAEVWISKHKLAYRGGLD
jgi:hypothetical protein